MNVSNTGLQYGVAPPGFRLPAATHVGVVRLQVSDLSRSLDYYREVLGFRVVSERPGVAVLGSSGSDDAIVELHERPGAAPVPRRGRLGLYHFAILLPDRASLGRFVAHLAELGLRAGMSDHFVSEAVYLQDPDGLGIEVYADRPRESWKHEDRQVVMVTEPLNVRDLVAAGAGGSWEGMPSGTLIGHVHLHVGDLDGADAFYHRALGLDRMVWQYPGALFLAAGGYHHHLGTNIWAASSAPAGEDDARLLEWELVLPASADLSAAAASLEGAGYEVEREAGSVRSSDPWGTRLRLVAAAREG